MEFKDMAVLLEEEDLDNNNKEMAMQSLGLLRNLPDEVGLQCLARLPRTSRAIASCVCRRWKQALQPHSIQPIRRALNITPEVWVFIWLDKRPRLIDPVSMRTKLIPFPDELSSANFRTATSVGGNQKLVFFGFSDNLSSSLYCYDTDAESWTKTPEMSEHRLGFASAQLGKYVYVAGGLRGQEHVRSAERFDMENNVWEEMSPMNHEKFNEVGFVMDDKFYVMGVDGRQNVSLECFDPGTKGWVVVANNWGKSLPPSCLQHSVYGKLSVAVLKNKLYAVTLRSTRILTLDKGRDVWETFACRNEPSGNFCTEILGVGGKIWKITHYLRKVKILCCNPTVKPLKWSRVQLGLNKRFKSSGASTTLSMG